MKLILVILSSILVAGCARKALNPLVGKWHTNAMSQFSRAGGIKMTYEFTDDGHFYSIRTFADGTEIKGNEVQYVVASDTICYTRTLDNSKWKDRYIIKGNSLTLTTIESNENKEFLNCKYEFERCP